MDLSKLISGSMRMEALCRSIQAHTGFSGDQLARAIRSLCDNPTQPPMGDCLHRFLHEKMSKSNNFLQTLVEQIKTQHDVLQHLRTMAIAR